tara:strand:+ start:22584 stop:23444 length:861 start_codon:yes stop_codon:yes gene_type:complete
MIFSFLKSTKLAQISFAFLASFTILFFNPNAELDILFFSSFLIYFITFLVCVLIISKNLYYTNNNYSSLALICFTFLLIGNQIKASVFLSSFFLLFTLRKVYLLASDKRANAKLFDIGFWFAISVITSYYSILFTPTILFGIFLFFKLNVKTLVKVLTGILTAVLIFLFTNKFLLENQLHTNFSIFSELQIPNPDSRLILILLIVSALFVYYIFKSFSSNLKTKMYNLFMIIYFLNSLALVLISKDLLIFLFFPFLISFSNIISKLRRKLIFEIVLILIIFVIYYL